MENANRATWEGVITPENLEPNPKNPIIASFFRNIGRADRLGSGVRNLFKYSKYYSGKDSKFTEGDIFRIVVPLNDNYSFDFEMDETKPATNAKKSETDATKPETDATKLGLSEEEKRILFLIKKNPVITQKKLQEETGISLGTVKRILHKLQEKGILARRGSRRSGKWEIIE